MSEDFLAGKLPDNDFAKWTDAQVRRREGHDLRQLLAEWDELLPAVMAGVEAGSIPVMPLINDTGVHQQDLRGLAGRPGGRDGPAYLFAADTFATRFATRVVEADLPAISVVTELGASVAGTGDPVGKVEASMFEWFRATSGRRSLTQIRGFSWTCDPEPYVSLVPWFGPPADDLIEYPTG